MKKISIFLLIVLLVSVFAGCGSSGNENERSTDVSATEGTPSDETEFVQTVLSPEDLDPRKVVYEYMYKMSQIKWTPSELLDLSSINAQLVYTPGTEYVGMPYVTQIAGNYEMFMNVLEDGKYVGPTDAAHAIGNHCSSSIINSWKQVSNTITASYTVNMMPNMGKGTIPVGEYVYEKGDQSTEDIVRHNKQDVIFDAYTKLQLGDAILSAGKSGQWSNTGHARMVVSLNIESTPGGKINPNRSTIKTIEQTNAFDKSASVKTNWYVFHEYTFTDLYSKNYIPVTVKELSETPEEPTFNTSNLNTPANIVRGKLKGIIYSNQVINSITVTISEKNGDTVLEETYSNPDGKNFTFEDRPLPDQFNELKAGRYFFKLTANIAYGAVDIHGFYFDKT